MRLQVSNLHQQESASEIVLEERNYLIGRDTDNDIVLDSFFVAQKQAILRFERGQVGIKCVGSATMYVNDEKIEYNVTRQLSPNDEIKIGHHVLTLHIDRPRRASKPEEVAAQRQANELERSVHGELLERLDLRKVDARAIQTEEYKRRVETVLNEIIDSRTSAVSQDVLDYVSLYMLREAVSICHMTSERRASVSMTASGLRQFDDYVASVYRRAAEDLTTKQTRSFDLQDIEEWIDAHYSELRYQIMAGLKAQLVRIYVRTNVMDTVFGFGPLEPLLKFPNITEIMVVHPSLIYVEKNGILQRTGRQFVSGDVAMSVIERIVAPLGLRVDRSSPLVDARLPDGSRVNVVIPPIAIKGPCITVRKFSKIPLTMVDLVEEKKTISRQVAEFLKVCVLGRKNILISGGTGAGKTTLLNCLSEYIPPRERIVTIEDSAELQLKQEHVVSLEARPPNVQGKGAYTIRDLVRNALRMRPDRVIIGECRGAEALDMLQAMNTGHDGSMTTGHANTPPDMLRRLETMVLLAADMPVRAIREQIASAVDIVIQYTRFGDGSRKVTQVSEIVGLDEDTGEVVVEDVFRFAYSPRTIGGQLEHTGYIPTFFHDLVRRMGVSLNLLFDATELPR